MKTIFASILLFLSPIFAIAKELPQWFEQDSITAISSRIKSDFSLTLEDGISEMKKLYNGFDKAHINKYISNHYIEVKEIDNKIMLHRKSPRNFGLLCPKFSNWNGRGASPNAEDLIMVKEILSQSKGNGSISNGQRIKYRFSINIPCHDFIQGDSIHVWMPIPLETLRQKNIKIISASHNYIQSKGNSAHNTLYFTDVIPHSSDSIIHFEYVGQYDVYAQHFSKEYILKNIQSYDVNSEIYKKYTNLSHKHIIRLDSLAHCIVGDETNPYLQSELVYEYISSTYPWAGAREYSTIECIPQYVLDVKHGDCGQVALLYISLMRTLGVPARWESGWMLHPWSKNLHDWAEVYFEGIGWVPVDVSFGRYINSSNENERNFFSTSMDNYRFATNNGICSLLYPEKKFIRSETIDFQMGEVETTEGNLFYPGWAKNLEVLSITELK